MAEGQPRQGERWARRRQRPLATSPRIYFQKQTGTSFQLVPYRGGAPLMQDLIGGQIDFDILPGGEL